MSTRSPTGTALVALAALVVAGASLVVGVLRPEPAAAAGATCVAVVVDFRALGGTVQTGCAQGDPSTGLQALGRAGFGYVPRPRDGLICQIDQRPACTDSTSSTYWSYWYRAPHSSRWVYASAGAGTHDPEPGSTDAWVWQDGGRKPPPNIRADTICPQLAATPSATPKPPEPKPTASASTTPSRKASKHPKVHATRPTTSTTSAAGLRSSEPPASPATTAPTTSAAPAPPTDGPTIGAGAAPTPSPTGGGGALGGAAGVALGGVVVLGLGAATLIRARRGRP